MAGDLQNRGVHLHRGVLFQRLRFLQFRLRLLPDSLRVGEFLLRQLNLTLRLLPGLLRVCFLRHGYPQLLLRLLSQCYSWGRPQASFLARAAAPPRRASVDDVYICIVRLGFLPDFR